MFLVQVDNLIIPPPMSAEDYIQQLEADGLGEEDAAALASMRGAASEQGEAADEPAIQAPPALRHLFKKHFRQGRFLMATESEGAVARVIRDLGFAAFVNAPAAFISRIEVRPIDQMVVVQASALTDWFAEVETPVGKVYGLHYPASWINLPAPVDDPEENPVTAILKKIMLHSAPLAASERYFPEEHSDIRWLAPNTRLQVDFEDGATVTNVEEVLSLANSVTERHLRIRRIAGGDLFTAEVCRPLFREFFNT